MQKSIFTIILWGLTGSLFAQTPKCGYTDIVNNYKQYPAFAGYYDGMYAQQPTNTAAKTTNTVYRIPVVFHIVYKDQKQNIGDSVILNQLQVMNDAYRHRHTDTSNIRPVFKPFAGDTYIEFYLATTDPNGNPTTGITRTKTNVTRFGDFVNDTTFNSLERIKKTAEGGIDPWDTKKYLNIWVGDIGDSTYAMPILLGYAPPPTNPLPPNWKDSGVDDWGILIDGVVIQYQAIGTNNPYNNELNGLATAGRITVHEVGHYLGLRHISGDAQGTSKACTPAGDDGISDTPPQSQQSGMTINCPSATQNTCTTATNDLPDMWENYMDYSNDKCQALFTNGQATHMRVVLENQRNQLIKYQATGIATTFHQEDNVTVYPQPATNSINIEYTGQISSIKLYNMLGQNIMSEYGNNITQLDVSKLASGNYIINIQTDKGTTIAKRIMIK